MDGIDGFFNDASKGHAGHQDDDNYQGHGKEDYHDIIRASFFDRAGILDAFEEAGVVRRKGASLFVAKTRLTLDTLLDEDEVTIRRSVLSNKHQARRVDLDRLQYSMEESLLIGCARDRDRPNPSRVPLAMARVMLNSAWRIIVLEDGEGDQIVFDDPKQALACGQDYVEHNSEHWCEPVQDFVNDDLNLAERYFFVCDHPLARQHQDFYPHDYLHTSSSLMYEKYKAVARDDPVMAWLLDTARIVAQDQRQKSVTYDRIHNPYAGPKPPDGMTLVKLPDDEPVEALARVQNGQFVIDLPRGKMRTVMPRVLVGKNKTQVLTDIYPDFKDFCNDRHQWIGDYRATYEIGDQALAQEIQHGLDLINQRWGRALTRTEMPPTELRASIAEANNYVLEHGQFSL